MKQKALFKVFTSTAPEAEEPVLALFEHVFKAPAISYKSFRTGKISISIYCREPRPVLKRYCQLLSTGMNRIRDEGLQIEKHPIKFASVRNQDWAHSWKHHFQPMNVSGRLLIKPPWSRRRPKKGQLSVILDPGLSFGTGQHPTTMFCLRQLVAHTRKTSAPSLLDIGTGSGILAIAAARLGFHTVQAFDFDPVSVKAAKSNARRNGVDGKIHVFQKDVSKLARTSPRAFSLVCANLISNLLCQERKKIAERVAVGGTLVLAGILAEEFETIVAAYGQLGFVLKSSRKEKEWRSGAFVRRPKF